MKILKKIWVSLVVVAMFFSCSNSLSKDIELSNASVEEGYGYIHGAGWIQKIKYEKVGGAYIYEGDIAIHEDDIFDTPFEADSRGSVTNARLWPNNTVYYEIAPNVYSRTIIINAFAHIEARTNIKFVEHSAANSHGNYLYIKPDTGSWSYIGCTGRGKQELALADWANTGVAVHELCHALGVYHEQSRKDRDEYLIINFSNIKAGMEGNFSKASGLRDYDIGYFDFTSIMLYGPTAFSKNGQPTITKKDGSAYTTQRDNLSSQDIAGLDYLYPGNTTVDTEAPTTPSGLVSSVITSNSFKLNWQASTDNIGVTAYNVYVDGVKKATVSGTNTTVSGLSALTTYRIKVSALDAVGNESVKSSEISVTTIEGSTGDTEWAEYTNYKTGDIVTYLGSSYKCITGHMSLPGWNPAAVPALWSKQ